MNTGGSVVSCLMDTKGASSQLHFKGLVSLIVALGKYQEMGGNLRLEK